MKDTTADNITKEFKVSDIIGFSHGISDDYCQKCDRETLADYRNELFAYQLKTQLEYINNDKGGAR